MLLDKIMQTRNESASNVHLLHPPPPTHPQTTVWGGNEEGRGGKERETENQHVLGEVRQQRPHTVTRKTQEDRNIENFQKHKNPNHTSPRSSSTNVKPSNTMSSFIFTPPAPPILILPQHTVTTEKPSQHPPSPTTSSRPTTKSPNTHTPLHHDLHTERSWHTYGIPLQSCRTKMAFSKETCYASH